MEDQPRDADLLAAVSAFLDRDVRPRLDGELAFQTRVAARVLDQVRRALSAGDAADREARRRLTELLGESGDTATLTARLCARIAAGEMTVATPGLTDFLWFVTFNKLAVHQPGYATYVRLAADVDPGVSHGT